MGDRVVLWIECRQEGVPKVKEFLFGEAEAPVEREELLENGLVRLEDSQANYGLFNERQELATTGVPFVGGHGAGCEFGDALFASVGEEHHDVLANFESQPVVAVMPNGEIRQIDLDYAREYLDARDRALRAMGVDPDTLERLAPAEEVRS